MKKLFIITFVLFSFFQTAYTQTDTILRIDATSKETLKSSSLLLKEKMPEKEFKSFAWAVMKTVNFYENKYGKGEASDSYIKAALHNKTPEEIISNYKIITYEQAKIDVAQYYKAQEEIKPDLEKLAKLVVVSYTFDSVVWNKTFAVTKLTLKNNFTDTITSVEFFTTVYAADGTLIDKIRVYSTQIDIAPNETKTEDFRYIHANKTCKEITQKRNTIKVDFIAFENSKHEVIVDNSKFTERDKEDFERLISKYPELKQ